MIYLNRINDRELINKIPRDKISDFIFLHLRNMWAVDGLYYLGIEEKWGTEEATEIDRKVWEIMGKIEARKIKEFFKIKENDLQSFIFALRYSGWTLDLEDKEIIIEKNRVILRNTFCRVQNTRLNRSLPEFGCKPVRFGFLKAFAKEFNPEINVKCKVCPPDEHPENVWCEWEFKLKDNG